MFFAFLKGLILEGKSGLLHIRRDENSLSPELHERIYSRNAVDNAKRIVPFTLLILFVEVLNQITIFMTDAYPAMRRMYLSAGVVMIVMMVCAVAVAYRILNKSPAVNPRHCRSFYRAFWVGFSLNMLVFVYLEINTRGLTNNFFFLLILTAAFPLLSWGEAIFLFGIDILVTLPIVVRYGVTPHQMLQFPLITLFALTLSRVLYDSHQTTEITLEQLALTNQKLAGLARTDPLTGLLNRRGVQVRLQETLARVGQACNVAFLMADIDLFKSYNDRFGHNRGDVCLQRIAGVLQNCVHSSNDFAARIGGEEFLVVLIDCEDAAAIETAQCLRREVVGLALVAATDMLHQYVTVSVGIATAQTPFEFSELYGQADRALYIAKNAGRNRVVQDDTIYPND